MLPWVRHARRVPDDDSMAPLGGALDEVRCDAAAGAEILAYRCRLSLGSISLSTRVPVEL